MRLPVLVLGVVIFVAPALAADVAPGAGRYNVAPSADGFIRLDTTTGALTHCALRDGVWFCDVLAEDRTDTDKRIAEVGQKLAAVTVQLARLAAEVATLDQRVKVLETAPPAAVRTEISPPADRQVAKKGFTGEVVRRFIRMVREMKRGEPAGT